jgi:regulator of replication initiation timing
LFAASNFVNMFQQQIESLKAKLDSAYQENQKLAAATKAFDSKKEVLITPAKDVKKEESTSETFNTMKQVCTPPSIDHRLLQRKKRPNSHGANVKRAILKTLSTDDSKPQVCFPCMM